MKQAEPFLYPKLSSIYNKIFQLAGAIFIIIALMSIWQSTVKKNKENLTAHFTYIAKQQLQQAITGTAIILEQSHASKVDKTAFLQRYLDGLSTVNFVRQAHLYDDRGVLIVSSVSVEKDKQGNDIKPLRAKSINDLYGISAFQRNSSIRLTPFIEEIRHTSSTRYTLHGYLRFTIEQSYLTDMLAKANAEQQSLQRLMLLLAGVVGFLLTRGLNRFSRRGYRLSEKAKKV